MIKFATYLHPHTCYTSKPKNLISFSRNSFPHYSKVRAELAKILTDYPSLSVRKVKFSEYLKVHDKMYLKGLLLMALEQTGDELGISLPELSIECDGLQYCLPGYLYGLGGMIETIDCMKRGVLDCAYCFSLGGHHGHKDWGHGYCLLNPMAAAVKYAQTQGFNKILIVDWDIHHGDGTQSIFSNDPNVYCISIHSAVDLYMAKASSVEVGTTTFGEKVGHCNLPILAKFHRDTFWEEVKLTGKFYRGNESLQVFQFALENLPWNPDLIMIASGYDSHKDDCGNEITDWTNQDFQQLTKYVLELAHKVGAPVISKHGGGYNLPVTISAAVSHVQVLASNY